jgi:hypothetical protein
VSRLIAPARAIAGAAALAALLLATATACGTGEEVGAPSPEGLYNLPTNACAGVDFAPFADLYGEPTGEPVNKVENRSAQCAQLFNGTTTEEGVRKFGGSVQVFLHRFNTPSEARAAYQRSAPSPTPTPSPEPAPEPTVDASGSPLPTPTLDGFPAPVEDVQLVRYEWSYGNTTVELVVGNILMTVEASSLMAGSPPVLDASAPPDPMLTLPDRVHDLIESVLKNLSG